MKLILIDTREHYKHEISNFLNSHNVTNQIVTLGDYCDYVIIVKDTITIQRKTIKELFGKPSESKFSSSMENIKTGMLTKMLPKYPNTSVFILEGEYMTKNGFITIRTGKIRKNTGLKLSSLQGLLLTLQDHGIRVVRTMSLKDTMYELLTIYNHYNCHRIPLNIPKYTNYEHRLGFLCHCNGIGLDLAQKLAFYSIRELSMMGVKDLTNINGIGKEKAKVLVDFFGRK